MGIFGFTSFEKELGRKIRERQQKLRDKIKKALHLSKKKKKTKVAKKSKKHARV